MRRSHRGAPPCARWTPAAPRPPRRCGRVPRGSRRVPSASRSSRASIRSTPRAMVVMVCDIVASVTVALHRARSVAHGGAIGVLALRAPPDDDGPSERADDRARHEADDPLGHDHRRPTHRAAPRARRPHRGRRRTRGRGRARVTASPAACRSSNTADPPAIPRWSTRARPGPRATRASRSGWWSRSTPRGCVAR